MNVSDELTSLESVVESLDSSRAYVLGGIVFCGLVGNSINMTILVRRRLVNQTWMIFDFFLFVLAIADIIVLVYLACSWWLAMLTERNTSIESQMACKLKHFTGTSAQLFSVWVNVIMSAERAQCIRQQTTRQRSNRKVRFVKKLIIMAVVVLAAVSSHYFYHAGVVAVNTPVGVRLTCKEFAQRGADKLFQRLWHWFFLCIYSFVPFTVILGANAIIVYTMYNNRSAMKTVQTNASGSSFKQNLQVAVMLLLVTSCFVLTTTPISALNIYITHMITSNSVMDHETRLQLKIGVFVCVNTAYLGHAVNFLLYVISGPKFRRDMNSLIHCRPIYPERRASDAYVTIKRMSCGDTTINGAHLFGRQSVVTLQARKLRKPSDATTIKTGLSSSNRNLDAPNHSVVHINDNAYQISHIKFAPETCI